MITPFKLGPAYMEVATDVSLVTGLQVPDIGVDPNSAELTTGANLPDADVVGKQLVAGDSVLSDYMAEIGTAGKLYARKHFSSRSDAPVYLNVESAG